MAELLLEVRSGDLPAGQAGSAVRRLKENLVAELRGREFGPRQSGVGYTPRRLIVMLRGLPAEESRDDLHSALLEIVPEVVARLKWPQAPSWDGRGQWPRPINGVLCLFDGETLEIEIAGVKATDQTVGHAFLTPEPVTVENAADFARKLQARGVELRPAERQKLIRAGLEAVAKEHDATPIVSDGQVESLADECEVPGVFSGRIDTDLVELPRELVIAFLELRQGAIALERDGELLPWFVVAADRADDPKGLVRRGHEVSVRAHLEEMRSLWQKDLATPLAERYRALADSEYGTDLGSWRDKAGRVADLAESFCRELDLPGEASMAAEAARLLKADLECELVREIPSLAGTVGGLLAREEGYPESVWQAIADQYRPNETSHTVPRGRVGKITALADRLDALVGCFVAGASSPGGSARRRIENPRRCGARDPGGRTSRDRSRSRQCALRAPIRRPTPEPREHRALGSANLSRRAPSQDPRRARFQRRRAECRPRFERKPAAAGCARSPREHSTVARRRTSRERGARSEASAAGHP